MLSALYARVAARRRRWFEQHPDARRRLSRPVVSVGALAAGGRGKDAGDGPRGGAAARRGRMPGRPEPRLRPAGAYRRRRRGARPGRGTGGRGHGRRRAADAGRTPPGRHGAGRRRPLPRRSPRGGAVRRHRGMCSTDGFQHLRLARDVDLVLVRPEDIEQSTFPAGRLRERPGTAALADALIVDAPDLAAAGSVAARLGVARWFLLRRSLGAPRPVAGSRGAARTVSPVLAVAGIAAPERFRDALTGAGFDVAVMLAFAAHRRFTRADVRRIAAQAAAHGAGLVLTTEKDGRAPRAARPRSASPSPPCRCAWRWSRRTGSGRGCSSASPPRPEIAGEGARSGTVWSTPRSWRSGPWRRPSRDGSVWPPAGPSGRSSIVSTALAASWRWPTCARRFRTVRRRNAGPSCRRPSHSSAATSSTSSASTR